MCICVVRCSMASGTTSVKAMHGSRSRRAHPTPVLRFVAPGPNVPKHAPGTPVSRPQTVAMKPPAASLLTRTNWTRLRRQASM